MAYTHAYVSSVEPLQISSTRSLSIRWSLPADASNTKAVARDSTESIFDPHRQLGFVVERLQMGRPSSHTKEYDTLGFWWNMQEAQFSLDIR